MSQLIDHGALRCAAEHVFIDGERLTLIDFSHSSTNRHPNNVTSLVAGLLWGTRLAQDIRRVLPLPERDALLPWLQNYKRQPERHHFQALLHAIGLNEQDTCVADDRHQTILQVLAQGKRSNPGSFPDSM